jgi:hypothetical protein
MAPVHTSQRRSVGVFDELTPTCEAPRCERVLTDPALVFRDAGGERRAYECVCGTITVTVAKTQV